ncbi:hypothetical protein VTN02DRAFT_6506 [Thermoascus thermophilus]
MVVNSPTRALVNRTDDGAVYIGPRPPPGSNHRYVFLLFEQPDGYALPECYSHILPVTIEARAGFDIEHFMQVTKLRQPAAGNYFFVEGDGDVTTTLTATTTSVLAPVCSNGGRPFEMINAWVTKWEDGKMIEVRMFIDGPVTTRILHENEIWTNSSTDTDHREFIPGPRGMPDMDDLAQKMAKYGHY